MPYESPSFLVLMEESGGSSSSSDDGKNCRRGHWRPAEDDKLRQLVEQFGPRNWNSIAEKIEGRTGKSCRLRWFNQLDPRINRKPFTEEEEEKLLAAHRKYGNKWSLIARLFPGRTDNAVKNHYHVIIARQRRERPKVHADHEGSFHDHSSTVSNPCTDFRGYSRPRMEFCNSELGYLKLRNPKRSGMFSSSLSASSSTWTLNGSLTNIHSPNSYHCIEDPLLRRHGLSSISIIEGNNHQFCAPRIPKFERVINHPHSFGFSNLGIGYNGSKGKINSKLVRLNENSTTISKWEIQEEQADESNNHKKVPFIDFLGVGISS